MKAAYLIFLMLIFLVISCKRKAEPLDETTSPVFYAKGYIANEAINIEAGIGGFYLQTDNHTDVNNVNEFTGNLKQTCASCNRSLKITIKDYEATKGGNFASDSSLMSKDYDYNLTGFSNIPFYRIKFTATPDGQTGLRDQLWEFSDGSTSSQSTFSKQFQTGTDQQIKYTCNYTNFCSSTLSYHIRLNPFMNLADLPDFKAEKLDSAQIIYQFTALGNDQNTYIWNMGDGHRLIGKTVFYGFDTNGVFTVNLTQINATDSSEVSEISKNIRVGNTPDCKANFITQIVAEEDPLNLSTVSVEWTNDAGDLFTSAAVKQSYHNNFKVLESTEYKTNNNGQKTRLLKLLINCKLSNGLNTIEVKNLEAKMAVAHP